MARSAEQIVIQIAGSARDDVYGIDPAFIKMILDLIKELIPMFQDCNKSARRVSRRADRYFFGRRLREDLMKMIEMRADAEVNSRRLCWDMIEVGKTVTADEEAAIMKMDDDALATMIRDATTT